MPTIKEVVSKIKKAGVENVRKIPATNGMVEIQIRAGDSWYTIMEDVPAKSADDIIRQASNKVILG